MLARLLPALILSVATPGLAQSPQEQLQSRYDRALAAGYKALFTCSAIANTERGLMGHAARSLADIEAMELTGIQPPLDAIVPELDAQVLVYGEGVAPVAEVRVPFAEGEAPRIAWHRQTGGCSLLPIGMAQAPTPKSVPFSDAIAVWTDRKFPNQRVERLFERGMGDAYGKGTRTTAIVVSRKGRPAIERYSAPYGPFTPQRTWSVAKSIAATLVGAAVHRGSINVADSAGLGLTEDDPRRAITIDQALRMASGRYSDTPGNRTDALYYGGATVDEVSLDWPLVHRPGTVFRYANNDTLAATQAIAATFETYPPAEFFRVMQMGHTVAETDWRGNYILSSQVWSTAQDLVRLGELYLADGVLPSGERLLPEGWASYVSAPSGPQPEGARGWGYGAGFWLFDKHRGIPRDTFFAAGNRGQYVVIVPSRDLVIVRRGEDPAGTRFDIEAFTRDTLATVGD